MFHLTAGGEWLSSLITVRIRPPARHTRLGDPTSQIFPTCHRTFFRCKFAVRFSGSVHLGAVWRPRRAEPPAKNPPGSEHPTPAGVPDGGVTEPPPYQRQNPHSRFDRSRPSD